MSSHNDYNRFVRPHYFSGMMLTAQDLQAEQDYHDWHNGAWAACGKSHPLALVKFIIRRGQVRLADPLKRG